MQKKLISLLLISSLFIVGCSKNEKPENNTVANINSTFNYSSNTTVNENIVFTNQTSDFSPYNNLGNLLLLPDKANNNRLSTMVLPLEDGFLKDSDIKDIYNYSIESLAVIGNSIFFTNIGDNNCIYKLDYEKNDIVKLGSFSGYKLVSNRNSLYFIDINNNNRLMSYNVDEDKLNSISNDKVGKFIINGELILYQNLDDRSSLYSIKIDGSSRTKLTNFSVDSFVPYEGELLIINSDDNNSLYKLDSLTDGVKRIASLNGSDMKIYNNSIYFLSNKYPHSLHKLSVDLNNDTHSISKPLISNVNEYYLTPSGILLELSTNVNYTYKLPID